MERNSEEIILIRRYIFGETTEAETRDIEERMMTDDDFFSQVISLEDKFVEQYAEGYMPREVKERFEESFLSTPEGRDQVLITKELLQYALKGQSSKSIGSVIIRKLPAWSTALANSYLRVAALILILTGLSFGLYRAFFYMSDADKGLAELRRIYKDARPTEARLTEFDYAPWSVPRSDDHKDEPERGRTAYAERLLLDGIYANPGAESYHALGVFYLTERQFDNAVAQFEMSATYAAPDARLHTDWGTALLEKGRGNAGEKKGRVVEDFSESFVHLQRAVELDPSRLDAFFNLALLFEAQGMTERAKEAWEDYLGKDSNSKWADEAREKLRRLEESRRVSLITKEELLDEFIRAHKAGDAERAWLLLSRSREPISGKSVTEQLLDLYIENSLMGDKAKAQYALNLLSFASQLEFRKTKERYSQTLVAFYRRQSLADLQMLKRARDLTKQGHGHYVGDQYDRAIGAYTEARTIFDKLENEAEAAASVYWIAYCYMDMYDTRSSLPLLKELTRYCDAKQFRWLFMRCMAGMAANFYVQRKHSEAAKHYHVSLGVAEEISDPISAINALDSLTELYRAIGNHPRSFECIQRGYALIIMSPLNSIQRLRHYSIVASALVSTGMFEAALEYQKESLKGDVSNALVNAAVAYAHLGALYAKQKKYDEAYKSIELAYETAKRISTKNVSDSLVAYSSLCLGNIYREGQDYHRAIATYTDTIETFSRLGIPAILYQAHKGRVYCFLANKDDRLIQEELDTALRILEGDRSSILEADDRNNFFDKEQNVYDIAIEYAHFRAPDDPRAFEFSEISRGRSLLDMMKGATTPGDELRRGTYFRRAFSSMTLKEIKEHLPEQAQIVQYSVLNDRIIVWLISKSDTSGEGFFSSKVLEVNREKLEADVKSYLRLISQLPREGAEDWRRLSAELFDALISPILESLDSRKTIYIVPDKVLSYLPFESLISTVTGKYLLEDFNIAYAPSSSVFITCSKEAQTKESPGKGRILSVGNPAFDREAFPALANLLSARIEAEKVAEFYDSSVVLPGEIATEQRVKSEMVNSDVVHIAAHAVLDEYSSDKSKLILAKPADHPKHGPSEDGLLEADEIYKLRLPRTKLVVLSSCHSGVDRYYKGEGMLSLARPFIAAGVPLVIASLWKVDSDSASDLMVDFHMYRTEGNLSSVGALKEAKLKMIKDGPKRYRHPYYWGPFVAIGGHI
jgi:CHAT domain-containing protein